MAISKGPEKTSILRRSYVPHARARDAFRTFLAHLDWRGDDCILLPSFIGWSAREGSGVFDPVRDLGLTPVFYRLDKDLRLDLQHFEQLLAERKPKVVVLIHYFGYVDPASERAIRMAREHGSVVLEDEAHAMLTDVVGGASGRWGDAAIYSLHKILPVDGGGVLVWNAPREEPALTGHAPESPWPGIVATFDLWAIGQRRHQNAVHIHQGLAALSDEVVPLWGMPDDGEFPQTYPVLIRNHSRDELYFRLNELGFGVTSLYHTLIPEITKEDFPESHWIASCIMNLPVHQDIDMCQLDAMMDVLASLVR